MFEVVFLGTSASVPAVHRGLPASIILHKEHRFLIDCGEGTQRQILKSGLGFKRLNKILLTHDHLDHILGLGGLAATLGRWEALENIEIYGGRRSIERVKNLLFTVVFGGRSAPLNLRFTTLQPGVLFEDSSFWVRAVPVLHRGTDSFGFLFEEKSRRRFLNEQAEALGVPFGPERQQLVRGESITLADGRVVEPEDVLGPEIAGTKLLYIGDTGQIDNLLEFAHNADLIIIESTYLEQDAAIARQFSHLTAASAARLAHQAQAKQLCLTHVSRRYREQEILDEARAIFPNTIIARDFDRLEVTRRQ